MGVPFKYRLASWHAGKWCRYMALEVKPDAAHADASQLALGALCQRISEASCSMVTDADMGTQAAEDAIRQVQEQEREVQNETAAFKRETARAEAEGQRLAALLDRASKDAQQLQGKADAMQAKQEMIKVCSIPLLCISRCA